MPVFICKTAAQTISDLLEEILRESLMLMQCGEVVAQPSAKVHHTSNADKMPAGYFGTLSVISRVGFRKKPKWKKSLCAYLLLIEKINHGKLAT